VEIGGWIFLKEIGFNL